VKRKGRRVLSISARQALATLAFDQQQFSFSGTALLSCIILMSGVGRAILAASAAEFGLPTFQAFSAYSA
jgi:hypothetical protein